MIRIALLLAGLALVLPRDAVAEPKIHLSWQGCTPTQLVEPYTQTDHVLTVLLDGAEGDFSGIDVKFAVFDPCFGGGAYVPDAWRFDAAGCRAGELAFARPAVADGCPGLIPGGGITVNKVTTGILEGSIFSPMAALFVQVQTAFATRHLSAGTRYVVAQVTIPMAGTLGGADPTGQLCGCAAAPRALVFASGSLLGAAQINLSEGQMAFWVQEDYCSIARTVPPGLAAADPAPTSCLVTPAIPSTWGALKGSYR